MDIFTRDGNVTLTIINGGIAERAESPTESTLEYRVADVLAITNSPLALWKAVTDCRNFESTMGRPIGDDEIEEVISGTSAIETAYENLMKARAGEAHFIPSDDHAFCNRGDDILDALKMRYERQLTRCRNLAATNERLAGAGV